jgi:hypothetical protein
LLERIALLRIRASELQQGDTFYDEVDGSFLRSKFEGNRRLRSFFVYVEDAGVSVQPSSSVNDTTQSGVRTSEL